MQTDNIHWIWEKSSRRRHIALMVDEAGQLKVKTPLRTSQKKVEALIVQKSVWIEKAIEKQQGRIHPRLPEYSARGRLYFLGRSYAFSVSVSERASVAVNEDEIFIEAKNADHFKRSLQRWYQEQTALWVESFIADLEPKIEGKPSSVAYRLYKKRWGSCDSRNNLMFNSLLSVHKIEYIKYVVAHELAHMRVKNHSAAFYQEGERILEGFRRLDRAMRD